MSYINNPSEIANITKGTELRVTLEDNTTIAGTFISVNSKGINLRGEDGKTITRTLSRVTDIETFDNEDEMADTINNDEDEDLDEEMSEDDEADMIADEFTSGETDDLAHDLDDAEELLSASEAAALFRIEAKELRVIARAAGLGVGQGRQYAFTGDDLKTIRAKKNELDAAAKAKAEAAAANA